MLTCFVGVDDGYFKRSWRRTVLAAAAHCYHGGTLTPCLVSLEPVTVDGADATYSIRQAAGRLLPRCGGSALLLLDTPIYAGFNVADPQYLSEELGVPLVTVYHYPPDRDAIARALEKHFPGERWRLSILVEDWRRLRPIDCPRGRLYIACYGIGFLEAVSHVCSLQLFTRTPEPLYTAGTVASAVSRFLWGGKP